MTKAEMILKKLKVANYTMFSIKVNADLLNIPIPEYLSNDIRLELDNLRESLYIVDRDVTAWMETTSTQTKEIS